MNTNRLINKDLANLVCHFCGQSKPIYLTVTRGLFRLCRECLLKSRSGFTVK